MGLSRTMAGRSISSRPPARARGFPCAFPSPHLAWPFCGRRAPARHGNPSPRSEPSAPFGSRVGGRSHVRAAAGSRRARSLRSSTCPSRRSMSRPRGCCCCCCPSGIVLEVHMLETRRPRPRRHQTIDRGVRSAAAIRSRGEWSNAPGTDKTHPNVGGVPILRRNLPAFVRGNW